MDDLDKKSKTKNYWKFIKCLRAWAQIYTELALKAPKHYDVLLSAKWGSFCVSLFFSLSFFSDYTFDTFSYDFISDFFEGCFI